jgi:hypothetical protein
MNPRLIDQKLRGLLGIDGQGRTSRVQAKAA